MCGVFEVMSGSLVHVHNKGLVELTLHTCYRDSGIVGICFFTCGLTWAALT